MIHGGALWERGRPPEVKDFSVNLNPLGTPAFLEELIEEAVKRGVHKFYPDDYSSLKQVIAEVYGVDPGLVGVFNGATEAIRLLGKGFSVPEPNFVEYPRSSIYFAEEVGDSFRFPIRGEKVIISNPNNPTGAEASFNEVLSALQLGKEVVVDESFADIGLVKSFAKYVEEFPNLLVISTFTKSLSVPGLRIGFTLGAKSRELEVKAIPWRVNSIAYYVFSNVDPKEVRRFFAESRRKVEELLAIYSSKKLPGKAYRSRAPFFLWRTPCTSRDVVRYLLGKGYLVRDASNFVGLDSHYIRVALKDGFEDVIQFVLNLCENYQRVLKESFKVLYR
ncbi:MAG: aminotransferase class I/II-fold pyridoxal phosphate-dependent enzyme [Candidatus Aramenus sp.]|nr:aminotransferase class I/II-fold pyridoxal phosphate-dependent enzyme [Candidatus Aramenus sp.]